jgi:hypothetical protein
MFSIHNPFAREAMILIALICLWWKFVWFDSHIEISQISMCIAMFLVPLESPYE